MKYVIFGLGALGSNLLMQLIHLDPKGKFVGIDYDIVEDRNLATQAYLYPHIRMQKTRAMQVIIGLKNPMIDYVGLNKKISYPYDKLTKKYITQSNILLIDCFDNTESRKLLEGIDNCLHIGFSPQYTAEIIWGKKYTTPGKIPEDQDDICEMPYAISFINFVVSLSGIVIKKFLDTKEKDNFAIFDKYKIRKL